MFNFSTVYDKHYSEMLNKYNIYTLEEMYEFQEIENGHLITENLYKISYHLAKRKQAEEIGIHYPYFLSTSETDINE